MVNSKHLFLFLFLVFLVGALGVSTKMLTPTLTESEQVNVLEENSDSQLGLELNVARGENVSFSPRVNDQNNNTVKANIIIKERDSKREVYNGNISRTNDKLKSEIYNLIITPEEGRITKIEIFDYNVSTDVDGLLELEIVEEGIDNFDSLYAINPKITQFTTMNVTVIANANALTKCVDFTFGDLDCYGGYKLFKTGLIVGQEYTFEMNSTDPGFGEINITEAIHLDNNRSFISDIFNETWSLDDVWSEPIYHDEYVRVDYQKNLTNKNDITVVSRNSNSGENGTTIEIYHFNTTNKIGEFSRVIDGRNRFDLTNMTGNHSRFDLKIKNYDNDINNESTAFIEFDYITDPSLSDAEAFDVDIAILNGTTGEFVIVWCETTSNDAKFQVLKNGNVNVTGPHVIEANTGGCMISVDALNSTHFAITYVDDAAGSSDWAVAGYDNEGTQWLAPTNLDTDINDNYDVGTAAANSTLWVSCLMEDQQNAVTYSVFEIGNEIVADSEIESGAAPNVNHINQVECTTLNETAFIYTYLNRADEETGAKFSIQGFGDNLTHQIVQPTVIDSIGYPGAVSVAKLANEAGFVFGYCDNRGEDTIKYRPYDNNGVPLIDSVNITNGLGFNCGGGSGGFKMDVTALNTSDSAFAITYLDTSVNKDIYLGVYNITGDNVTTSFKVGDISASRTAVAIEGYNAHRKQEICNNETSAETMLIAWSNGTGGGEELVYEYFNISGQRVNGACSPSFAPIPTSVKIVSTTGNNLTTDNLTAVVVPSTDENITFSYSWYKTNATATNWTVATTLLDNPNLIAYFPFNNDTLDYAGDNAIILDGATYNATEGKILGGYVFDEGTNTFLNISSSASLDALSDASFSIWFKEEIATGPGNNNRILFAPAFSPTDRVQLKLAGGHIRIFNDIDDLGTGVNSGPFIQVNNTWHHVVFTVEGTIWKAYGNGIELISNDFGNNFADLDDGFNIVVGNNPFGGTPYIQNMNGTMDEIIIYDRALTIEEIQQLYFGGLWRGITIDESLTSAGDNWTLGVKSLDSVNISAETNSSSLEIILSTPVIDTLILNASSVGNITTDDLQGFITVSQDEGKNFTVDWNWYKTNNTDVNNTIATTLLDDAIAYFPLNNDTRDYIGNLQTVSKNVVFNYTDKKVGAAMSFNGVNSEVNVTDSGGLLNFGNTTDDRPFSVSGWFYFDNIVSPSRLVFKGTPTINEWLFTITGGGDLYLIMYDGNQANRIARFASSTPINAGQWYHFVGTYNGNSDSTGIDLYINNVLSDDSNANAAPYVAMHNTGGPMLLGSIGAGIQHFNGTMDEIMVFNKTLTTTEISQLYYGGQLGGDILNQSLTSIGDNWTLGARAITTEQNIVRTSLETNTTQIEILEGVAPPVEHINVTNLKPNVTLTYIFSDSVLFSVNITNSSALDTVFASITQPDGNSLNQTLINIPQGIHYNGSFDLSSFPSLILLGLYNVSFLVNDTNNLENNTETLNFTVTELVVPLVTSLKPNESTQFNIAQDINLSANVTDDYVIDTVIMQVIDPLGARTNFTLIASNLERYNSTFLLPNLTGLYNLTIFANDTSGNLNNTETTNFTVIDINVPDISNVSTQNETRFVGGIVNIGDNVTINATVSDDSGTVFQVWVEIYEGFVGSNVIFRAFLNLINEMWSIDVITNSTFPVADDVNFTIRANDSVGNEQAFNHNFHTVDNTAPDVTDLKPNTTIVFNISETIHLSANVTDDFLVDTVIANILQPNGTYINITLTNIGDQYNNTFIAPELMGLYNITILANDSTNNQNWTETYNFSVINPTPYITLITLNASSVDNVTSDNLTGFVTAVDLNGDNITIDWNWYKTNTTETNWTIATSLIDDAIAYFPFNNDTFDYAGPYDGEAINTSILNTTSEQIGKIGDFYTFKGVSARIKSQNIPSIDLGNVSFSLWIRPYNNVDVMGLLNQWDAALVKGPFLFTIGDELAWQLGETGDRVTTTTSPLVANVWQHIVVTRNATDSIIYYNGIEIIGVVDTQNFQVGNINFSIGNAEGFGGTNDYQGDMDEVIVFNRAISAEEVQQLYYGALWGGDTINESLTTDGDRWMIGARAGDKFNFGTEVNSTAILISQADLTFNPNVTDLKPNTTIIFNVSNEIHLSANITNDTAIDTALASIVQPNGSIIIVLLSNLPQGIQYNNTFIAPNLTGLYNVTFQVNDTIGGLNNTETLNFTINDIFAPEVTSLLPNISLVFNVGNVIHISANVTDNVGVAKVIADIRQPNGTHINVTLTNTTLVQYNATFLAPPAVGLYNITILANDTSNNLNNTETTNFTVTDTIAPDITNVSTFNITNDLEGDVQAGDVVTINVTVTDDVAVDSVWINIWEGVVGASSIIFQDFLTLITGIWTIDVQTNDTFPLGNVNFTIFANDTSNNVLNETHNISIIDRLVPNVTSLKPNISSVFNVGNVIHISANVTDGYIIDTVIASILHQNGSVINVTLFNLAGNQFNNTFIAPNSTGLYSITILANDTSGNLNNTEKTNFTVNDVDPPQVTDVLPPISSIFNITNNVHLSVNVTDNVRVDTVIADITQPNGTHINITLVNTTLVQYNASFVMSAIAGLYNVTFLANDTSNNLNNTEMTNFTVNDITSPQINVTGILPVESSNFNVSDRIHISANVTDDVQIDTVIANILQPNGVYINVTLTNQTAEQFNATFIAPGFKGLFTITILANDTSDNRNASEGTNFTIKNEAAAINITNPLGPTTLNGNVFINITWVDTENHPFVSNITAFNDTDVLEIATDLGNRSLNFTWDSSTISDGYYNLTWHLFDNATIPVQESNDTEFGFLVDNTGPAINILNPVNGSLSIGTITAVNHTTLDLLSPLDQCWWTNTTGTINNTYTCGENITGLFFTSGNHLITIYANDSLGNEGQNSTNFTIGTGLILTVDSPQNITYFGFFQLNISLNVSVNNFALNDTFFYSLDGAANITFNPNITLTILPGDHNILVYVNDTLGNVISQHIFFSIIEGSLDVYNEKTWAYLFAILLAFAFVFIPPMRERYILQVSAGILFIVAGLGISVDNLAALNSLLIREATVVVLLGIGFWVLIATTLNEYQRREVN